MEHCAFDKDLLVAGELKGISRKKLGSANSKHYC